MIVTILITSDNDKIKYLKNKNTKNEISNMFLHGINSINFIFSVLFLFFETYLMMSILISIFNNIATLYLSFYNNKDSNDKKDNK